MPVRHYGPYRVELTNPDKPYFPEAGLTKADLVEYYDEVAELMLPGLRDRPLSLQRFPDGLSGPGFYQKRVSPHFPDWLKTVVVASEGEPLRQPVVTNRASLVYLAGQGTVTFHPWLSRVDAIEHPDQLILDLDPSDDDFERVRRAAFLLRALLDEIGLASYVRLTGSRGVHIVTPLDRSTPFDEVREFSRDVAVALAARRPGDLTVEIRKAKREGRVFVDWLRNAYAQTAVASYSVRARPLAPVVTPITWAELQDPRIGPRSYDVRNIRQRLERVDDPWRGMWRHARSLARPRERLAALDGVRV
jgi:bifunctional non-homologous end joining protein LigD